MAKRNVVNKDEERDYARLGAAMAMAMVNTQNRYQYGTRPFSMKEADLNSALGVTTVYGRNSMFDPCFAGDIFGLQVQTIGLMNWLGWRPNKYYRRRVEFIPWVGPAGLAGAVTAALPSTGAGAPCDNPAGVEWSNCGYDLTHTSWYHRHGDALDPHTVVQDRCETSPRYRLNGQMINDDAEWQMNLVMSVLKQDITHDLIHGTHTNAYEMNGLEAIVKTGWTDDNDTPCDLVDSQLIDWDHDDLNGDNNGLGNFFDYLDELVTEIEYRSSGIGTISETDMILLTSRFMATCILDSYACYTTCGVTTLNDSTDQALRAQQRQLRLQLNGGPLYDGAAAVGYIQLKSGRRLPIMVDDALGITKPNANFCTDVYLLTRRIGSIDVLYGEFLDLREYQNRVQKQMPNFSVKATPDGRFAVKGKEDNWCVEFMMGTSPELYISAPWAQARISDVCCSRKRQPLSGDVFNPTYLPGGRPLHKAQPYVCPEPAAAR